MGFEGGDGVEGGSWDRPEETDQKVGEEENKMVEVMNNCY